MRPAADQGACHGYGDGSHEARAQHPAAGTGWLHNRTVVASDGRAKEPHLSARMPRLAPLWRATSDSQTRALINVRPDTSISAFAREA
jgi:hypothetical protein